MAFIEESLINVRAFAGKPDRRLPRTDVSGDVDMGFFGKGKGKGEGKGKD